MKSAQALRLLGPLLGRLSSGDRKFDLVLPDDEGIRFIFKEVFEQNL